MKIALVASSFPPKLGRLERRVDHLARGLALLGAQVEVLTQGAEQPVVESRDGVTVRRYATGIGRVRFAVAPKLWERLWLSSESFDVVDVHTRHAALALAVASARVRPLVFTPLAPMDAFLGWPYTRAMRGLVGSSARIVCQSQWERDRLCGALPQVAGRTMVVPDGVDAASLREARPLDEAGVVVLAVDRLGRRTGIGRAIAAMPSLDPEFRLVAVGDGPARGRLEAFAEDLSVSSRVQFVGAISDALLYRWLRTARVVVALSGERGSGMQVTEARAAGAPVVASELPANREAAERPGGGPVIFVAPKGSPLEVADAIDHAARLALLPTAGARSFCPPPWEEVVEATWELYRELTRRTVRSALDRGGSEPVGPAGHRRGRREGLEAATEQEVGSRA
jgi:glycosyltransferase involved in cell wall biosynthesis